MSLRKPESIDTIPTPIFGSVRLMAGYRTSRVFGWGVITGFDFNKKKLLVPITVAVRVNFLRKRIVPFLDGNVGYILAYEKKGVGHGLNTSVSAGCKFWVTKKLAVLAKVGLNNYIIFNSSDFYPDSRGQKLWGIPFSVGVEF